MSELVATENLSENLSVAEVIPFPLEVKVERPKKRPRKVTAEEAAFFLARGPYVGRLAAQNTLLEFAEQNELPEYAIEEVRQQIGKREQELADFEDDWQYKPAGVELPPEKTEAFLGVATILNLRINQLEKQNPETSKAKKSQKAQWPRRSKLIQSRRGLEWQEKGLCLDEDPDIFYPEEGESSDEAKQICLSCDVRQKCKDYSLEHKEEWGVWGGIDEDERRSILRRLNLKTKKAKS